MLYMQWMRFKAACVGENSTQAGLKGTYAKAACFKNIFGSNTDCTVLKRVFKNHIWSQILHDSKKDKLTPFKRPIKAPLNPMFLSIKYPIETNHLQNKSTFLADLSPFKSILMGVEWDANHISKTVSIDWLYRLGDICIHVWFWNRWRNSFEREICLYGYRVLPWMDDMLLAPSPMGAAETQEDCTMDRVTLDELMRTLGLLRNQTK